jgi:hypothetical protein
MVEILSESGIIVTLDIFSGRRNPTWELTQDQANVLKDKLNNLDPATPISNDILGYRGFIIDNTAGDTDLAEQIIVYNGVIGLLEQGEFTYLNDRNDLEGWLIEQATQLGFGDIIQEGRVQGLG